MIEPHIERADLETWAGILLDQSLGGIVPGDRVMIKGERICWPLMEVLERGVVAGGGIPDVLLVPPNNERGRVWSAAVAALGTPEQLAAVPDWHRGRYEAMNKYIEVLGAEDPSAYAGLRPDQAQALAATDRPYANLRLARRWALTLYPTPGFAAMEGLPLDEYVRFIVRASTTDPRPLRDAEERLAPLFRDGRRMVVTTMHPDGRELTLSLDITPSIPTLSYGLRNFPDGEIFTSPDARETRGEIFIDLPVHYGGHDIRGIHLRFEGGRIVGYAAEEGHQHLAAIVETDAGSHRLGEVALGMNPGLQRALKHPLLVEKVGGTLHVAIGQSYEGCYVEDPSSDEGRARIAELEAAGILNRSAQHVDIVADFRPGGCGRRVAIDDRELVVRDNVWVPA
ncbi:MAG: aminopeptidase [Thermoanaerobaculaceae bacterium]|jgi:aminopeptidase|nr:aminopeptidase [Thermoanaerobaculaceae bacterium]